MSQLSYPPLNLKRILEDKWFGRNFHNGLYGSLPGFAVIVRLNETCTVNWSLIKISCILQIVLDPDQAWQLLGLILTHTVWQKDVTNRKLRLTFANSLDPDQAWQVLGLIWPHTVWHKDITEEVEGKFGPGSAWRLFFMTWTHTVWHKDVTDRNLKGTLCNLKHLLLLAKYFICKTKFYANRMILENFCIYLKRKYKNEKYISKIRNRQEKFQAKWSALHQVLEDT